MRSSTPSNSVQLPVLHQRVNCRPLSRRRDPLRQEFVPALDHPTAEQGRLLPNLSTSSNRRTEQYKYWDTNNPANNPALHRLLSYNMNKLFIQILTKQEPLSIYRTLSTISRTLSTCRTTKPSSGSRWSAVRMWRASLSDCTRLRLERASCCWSWPTIRALRCTRRIWLSSVRRVGWRRRAARRRGARLS